MNVAEAKQQVTNTIRAYSARDRFGNYLIPAEEQRPLFLMGPPGIGKTAIVKQVAEELGIGLVSYSITHHTRQSALGLPKIVHKIYEDNEYDVSEYTMSEIIELVWREYNKGFQEGILFLDEFDKACSERYAGGSSGGSWSVSDLIQEQLLTTLDHQIIQLSGDDGKPFTVDTQKITVICMGAFTALREKKRLHAERRSIGFSSAASSAAETVSEITVEDLDLADFGMMPEIYGRLTPLLMDEVSPAMMLQIAEQTVKTLCDTTELHITVPETKLRLLAEQAFSSGQGGRAIMKRLQAALDEHIFEDPCSDMYVL